MSANRTVRAADSKGRIAFPGLANATVVIDRIGDSEFRVRKAQVIPEDELHFHEEEFPVKISARDGAKMVKHLKNPPPPNKAARRAAKRSM